MQVTIEDAESAFQRELPKKGYAYHKRAMALGKKEAERNGRKVIIYTLGLIGYGEKVQPHTREYDGVQGYIHSHIYLCVNQYNRIIFQARARLLDYFFNKILDHGWVYKGGIIVFKPSDLSEGITGAISGLETLVGKAVDRADNFQLVEVRGVDPGDF